MNAVAPGAAADDVDDAPGPVAVEEAVSPTFTRPTLIALTSGLPSYAAVEEHLARHGGHAEGVAIATDAAHDAVLSKRTRGLLERPEAERVQRLAMGRAPIVKMSRWMPPTPVAAPW